MKVYKYFSMIKDRYEVLNEIGIKTKIRGFKGSRIRRITSRFK